MLIAESIGIDYDNCTPEVSTEVAMSLTRRQERFVREYLIDMSPADAYVRAGYEVSSREVAWKNSHRLMKNAEVLQAIDQAQLGRMNRLTIDADWVIQRFQMIYLKAASEGDYTSALRALENIAKYLGVYEKHNRQKVQYTGADIDRLKADLTEAGFSFERAAAVCQN